MKKRQRRINVGVDCELEIFRAEIDRALAKNIKALKKAKASGYLSLDEVKTLRAIEAVGNMIKALKKAKATGKRISLDEAYGLLEKAALLLWPLPPGMEAVLKAKNFL
jgi:hypothetical protein